MTEPDPNEGKREWAKKYHSLNEATARKKVVIPEFKKRATTTETTEKRETIDFEKILQSKEVQNDTFLKDHFAFKNDEIEITSKSQDKPDPFFSAFSGKMTTDGTQLQHLRDAVQILTSEPRGLRKKYCAHSTLEAMQGSLEKQYFENLDKPDALTASQKKEEIKAEDIGQSGVLSGSAPSTDKSLSKPLFSLLQTHEIVLNPTPDAIPIPNANPTLDYQRNARYVSIEIKKLTFALGEIEPFFGILAVYDISKKQRVSENFHFQVNSDDMNKFVVSNSKNAMPSYWHRFKGLPKAVFKISQPSADLYLLLRIEKIFQKDTDSVTEPYLKYSSTKDKEKDKMRASLMDIVPRLGAFRQCFAWSIVPLFNEPEPIPKDSSSSSGSQPGSKRGSFSDSLNFTLALGPNTEFKQIYRYKGNDFDDQHFMDTVSEYSKTNSSKRNKLIPGSVTFDAFEVYATQFKDLAKDRSEFIRELLTPPVKVAQPHIDLFNVLYVYPLSLNFSNRGGSTSARNIAIQAQFLENDNLEIVGEDKKFVTCVTYHNKTPVFYDEFKMEIPLNLHQKHHVLFTFYHVSMQSTESPAPMSKSGSSSSVKEEEGSSKNAHSFVGTAASIVGYAVIPLFGKQRLRGSKETSVPVFGDLSSGYLKTVLAMQNDDNIPSSAKLVDNGKPLFKFRLQLHSSIYSTDKSVGTWQMLQSDPKVITANHVSTLAFSSPSNVILHLPTLLYQIIRVMCVGTDEAANAAFIAMNKMLSSVHTSIPDHFHVFLLRYLENHMVMGLENISKMEKHRKLFDEVISHWLVAVKKRDDLEDTIRFAWFNFQLISRSLGFEIVKTDNTRTTKLSPKSMQNLRELLDLMIQEVQQRTKSTYHLAKELNKSLSFFFKELLSVLDRGFVFELILKYAKEITNTRTSSADILTEFKFEMFKTLADYAFFVPLNLPVEIWDNSNHIVNIVLGAVNMPVASPLPTVPPTHSVLEEFQRKFFLAHYCIGLLIQEVVSTLKPVTTTTEPKRESRDGWNANKSARVKALATLRMTIQNCDLDSRYNDSPKVKQRVASMFFPLVLAAIDLMESDILISMFDFDEKRGFLVCLLWVLKNCDPELFTRWLKIETQSRWRAFLNCLMLCLDTFEYQGGNAYIEKFKTATKKIKKSEETKAALETFYTFDGNPVNRTGGYKNLRQKRLQQQQQLTQSLDKTSPPPAIPRSPSTEKLQTHQRRLSLENVMSVLSKDRKESKADTANGGSRSGSMNEETPPSTPPLQRFKQAISLSTPTTPIGSSKMDTLRMSSASRKSSISSASDSSEEVEVDSLNGSFMLGRTTPATSRAFTNMTSEELTCNELLEGNLCSQVSEIVLSTIQVLTKNLTKELQESALSSLGLRKTVSQSKFKNLSSSLFDQVFDILIEFMRRNQSATFLRKFYVSLSQFVSSFSKQIFATPNTYFVSELCAYVVQHCNYSSRDVRVSAASFLFKLIKINWEECDKNFTRTKVQTTIAISKGISSPQNFRQALDAISAYATGPTQNKALGAEIKQLCDALHDILKNIMSIHEQKSDIETMTDLYHTIARGYAYTSPDLRITWLKSFADFHLKNKHEAEAAMCYVHICALISEYLASVEPSPHLPNGCSAFSKISTNVNDESVIQEHLRNMDEEGVGDANLFSETELSKMMHEAIKVLQQAELYEAASEMYKLLLPLYEKNKSYEKLASCHGELVDIYTKVVQADQSQSRLLGSYYRVGFYGKPFQELDGKEFVYKEPKITRLGEIKERLQAIFAEKFKEQIVFLTDSSAVDKNKLDAKVPNIQLTSVSVYLEPWELKERNSYYEKNSRINRFLFSTPFTENPNRAQTDSVKDQFKRKTILTVQNQFPYIRTRALVTAKQEIILNPIENSIEAIESRTEATLNEIKGDNPILKSLQSVLQGSLLLQVHSGPKEICKVFLIESSKLGYTVSKEHTDRLKKALREFLRACKEALAMDQKLIGPDQLSLHNEMEAGYLDLKNYMEPHL